MGCWNATCGISQLPIRSGARVKVFLILQSEYANGICGSDSCYNSAYFRPWFLPVLAEYNDYGSIENIVPDWNSKFMLEQFQQWHSDKEVKILGDDAEINSPGIRKFKTLDNVFDCVERGALQYKNHGQHFDKKKQAWVNKGGYLKVGMFMVLETVFNELTTEAKRSLDEGSDYYKEIHAEDKAKAIKAIADMREAASLPTTPKLEALREMRETIHSMYIDKFLGGLCEEHISLKHYKKVLMPPNVLSIDDFFAKVEEMSYINIAMTYLRKLWIPQCGKGSQSESLSFNKALIVGMQKHIEMCDAADEKDRIAHWVKDSF